MKLFSFTAHFGIKEDCRNHFKEQRDLQGITCKKVRWSYECKNCKSRTSLRKRTIIEFSKSPFLV